MKTFFFVALFLMTSVGYGQQTAKADNVLEQKIRSSISQMTLQEKVTLLHANSKFYISGIRRLGIPELATSDGPHGTRAEVNRDKWAYCRMDK